ncbi:SDR family oxidoreductase [Paraurantiacibacter namhicola]|uniref:Glucose 1-dehydrogenase 4 n=1 Tax=Paraurantiacibacter namhicola TaxID=645517 RepID=A0A1C7D870_9SPHN|nr:SDR family oxidoreductase [Paraurantiacibacter namhicola]ANU07680.1 Glucose 1-dehydrogenase 4 [Paraurantiacibacter namhicola]
MPIDAPVVLVTGGAQRLGECIVRRFADAGWHVVIHCNTSRDAAEDLARELPSAEVAQCDLTDTGKMAEMVERLAASHTDWRVTVNCASVFKPDGAHALDPATNMRAMQVNARSPAMLAQAFLSGSRAASPRRVINVTDQKLANMNPDFFSYTMSKAAFSAASQMLAMAFPQDRITSLAPGAILPSHDQSEEEAEQSHRLNPLDRRTAASEVADAAYFLATGPVASGQHIYVDSGQYLCDQDRDVIYLAREDEDA